MSDPCTMRFAAKLENLAHIRSFVRGCVEDMVLGGDTDDLVSDLVFATNEIVTNIIEHGYKHRSGSIEIEVTQSENDIVVHVRDDAPLFDPRQVVQPNLDLPLEKRPLGKLGLFLTLEYMDDVQHRSLGEIGNEVTLVKHILGEEI